MHPRRAAGYLTVARFAFAVAATEMTGRPGDSCAAAILAPGRFPAVPSSVGLLDRTEVLPLSTW
jgi:hypothetical protein